MAVRTTLLGQPRLSRKKIDEHVARVLLDSLRSVIRPNIFGVIRASPQPPAVAISSSMDRVVRCASFAGFSSLCRKSPVL
jgi:hypothetical protein